MPKNTVLNGCLSEIESGFVGREATPVSLMKLSIQLHLAVLSLSNPVCGLELFGVGRVKSTVHNWVHKADLQPDGGKSPDHVAVDETVIQLDDERYWLYACVDPETNERLHTKLGPTRTNVLAPAFFTELREKHDVDDAVFLVDGATSLKDACIRHGLDLHYERHGNRNSVERVFREAKRRSNVFSNGFSHPKQNLSTSGSTHSPSHGISYSERDHRARATVVETGYLNAYGWAGQDSPKECWMDQLRSVHTN